MDIHFFSNRYQDLADVSGNSNNDGGTMDKETMNEQEIDRLNKKTYGKTYKRKVSNLKKVVILGDSIDKQANGWQLSKSLTNEKASVL